MFTRLLQGKLCPSSDLCKGVSGHVFYSSASTFRFESFLFRKLQPMITSEAGKALIQTCLNSPDPPGDDNAAGPPKVRR